MTTRSHAKELLDAATSLPWGLDDDPLGTTIYGPGSVTLAWCHGHDERPDGANAALIVYAVNTLPAYEAAVEALRRIVNGAGLAAGPHWGA